MSLDVHLIEDAPTIRTGSGIFVRDGGATREISRAEWDEKFPGLEPVTTDFDDADPEVYWRNITHNLTKMASAAGIYEHLWRPDELGITKASELVEPLSQGLDRLRAEPATFKAHNPPNGWGDYDGLVDFVEEYLAACLAYPTATVCVSR